MEVYGNTIPNPEVVYIKPSYFLQDRVCRKNVKFLVI